MYNIWKETKFPSWRGPLLLPFHSSNSRETPSLSLPLYSVSQGHVGNILKFAQPVFPPFSAWSGLCFILTVFAVSPFWGWNSPWLSEMTPHPYLVSPVPLPCLSQPTLHPSTGCHTFDPQAIWFMSVQCQIWAISVWHCGGVCGLMVTG